MQSELNIPVMAENGLLKHDSDDRLNEKNFEFPLTHDEVVLVKRETWGNKMDFLLSIIGFAVDLANVWRFPYFCYRNGGGAFLIPYFIMLIFGAMPLFYMELLLGQFHKQGAISLWKIAPIFKGVGWAIVTVSYMVSFYYNTVIGWSIYYFFASFTSNLPWNSCDNEWNTCKCWAGSSGNASNVTVVCNNVTLNASQTIRSTTEFFERKMLKVHKSDGLHDVRFPEWDITLCLLLTYVLLYLSLWKGVKTSGKVVYITAIMPYVILLALLIRGLFLEGATEGLYYFANPRFDRLADPATWIDAAFQIFYSVGAGFGVHIAMASYGKFDNNCYLDCLVTVAVNAFTSLFAGSVVFIYLGYMSVSMDKPIEEVASQGPSLVFEVYPQAIATLPWSTVWSLLFFFMLITLGMDSSMGGLESVATGVIDEFSCFFKPIKWHREMFTAAIVTVSFIISLAGVTSGGFFVVHLLDTFAAGTSLLLVVFFEAIAVAWFYGLEQFLKDAKAMLGFVPGLWWCICWKFISPIFLLGIISASVIMYTPLQSVLAERVVVYPMWGNIFGWMVVLASAIWVPVFAVYTLLWRSPGKSWRQRLATSISPECEHLAIQRGKPPKRFTIRHWLYIGWPCNSPPSDSDYLPGIEDEIIPSVQTNGSSCQPDSIINN